MKGPIMWVDQYKDSYEEHLSVAGIYSGIGSTMIGFIQNGFKPLWITDPRHGYLNINTIKRNYGNLKNDNKISAFSRSKDRPLVIVGQPACRQYSLLNRGMTREKIYKIDPDEVEYVKFLKQINQRQPEFFVLENLWRIRDFLFFPEDHGNGTFYAATSVRSDGKVAEVAPWVHLNNYTVHHYPINSAQYGLPQSRRRLFIIGHKKCYDDFFEYEPPNPDWEIKQDFKTVREAIGDLIKPTNIQTDSPINIPNHITQPLTPRQENLVVKTRPGTKNSAKEVKLEWDRYSPTIVSASIRHIHPYNLRYLTPHECALLMGYPNDFVFEGSINQTLDQIGKAITPPINKHIAAAIKRIYRRAQGKSKLSNVFNNISMAQ